MAFTVIFQKQNRRMMKTKGEAFDNGKTLLAKYVQGNILFLG